MEDDYAAVAEVLRSKFKEGVFTVVEIGARGGKIRQFLPEGAAYIGLRMSGIKGSTSNPLVISSDFIKTQMFNRDRDAAVVTCVERFPVVTVIRRAGASIKSSGVVVLTCGEAAADVAEKAAKRLFKAVDQYTSGDRCVLVCEGAL